MPVSYYRWFSSSYSYGKKGAYVLALGKGALCEPHDRSCDEIPHIYFWISPLHPFNAISQKNCSTIK